MKRQFEIFILERGLLLRTVTIVNKTGHHEKCTEALVRVETLLVVIAAEEERREEEDGDGSERSEYACAYGTRCLNEFEIGDSVEEGRGRQSDVGENERER